MDEIENLQRNYVDCLRRQDSLSRARRGGRVDETTLLGDTTLLGEASTDDTKTMNANFITFTYYLSMKLNLPRRCLDTKARAVRCMKLDTNKQRTSWTTRTEAPTESANERLILFRGN